MYTNKRHNAKGIIFLAWTIIILLLANFAQAQQQVEFNYNGRVKYHGEPFDGQGYFKFALVDVNGHTSFWSNDSTSVSGSEPTSHVVVQVIDGFFNVTIGDTLSGMDPLIPTVFNEDERIYLRVWFSHDLGAGFQRLNPDRRVVNPALLGQQSFDQDIILYVDAVYGDDANNGLTTDTAKATIQAAVNLLPARIPTNCTIVIFPGTYPEQVNLYGISVSPDKSLHIVGDTNWTPASPGDPNVIITGADDVTPTTPVRNYGMLIANCAYVDVTGLMFQYAAEEGLEITGSTEIEVNNCRSTQNAFRGAQIINSRTWLINCIFEYNKTGVDIGGGSHGIESCIFDYNAQSGINIGNASASLYGDNKARNNANWGCVASGFGRLVMHGTGDFSNNGEYGMHVIRGSFVNFESDYSGQMNDNGQYGLHARWNGFTEDHTQNTFSGNTLGDTLARDGGVFY